MPLCGLACPASCSNAPSRQRRSQPPRPPQPSSHSTRSACSPAAACVCRVWRAAAEGLPALWRNMDLSSLRRQPSDAVVKLLAPKRWQDLHSLSLSGCDRLTDSSLQVCGRLAGGVRTAGSAGWGLACASVLGAKSDCEQCGSSRPYACARAAQEVKLDFSASLACAALLIKEHLSNVMQALAQSCSMPADLDLSYCTQVSESGLTAPRLPHGAGAGAELPHALRPGPVLLHKVLRDWAHRCAQRDAAAAGGRRGAAACAATPKWNPGGTLRSFVSEVAGYNVIMQVGAWEALCRQAMEPCTGGGWLSGTLGDCGSGAVGVGGLA